MYVKQMAQRELLLKRADSAKMGPTPEEYASLHRDFVQAVGDDAGRRCDIDPKSLADAAKTQAERERLAAARVEAFLDKVMAGEAQPVPVPSPLQIVLMNKYDVQGQRGRHRSRRRARAEDSRRRRLDAGGQPAEVRGSAAGRGWPGRGAPSARRRRLRARNAPCADRRKRHRRSRHRPSRNPRGTATPVRSDAARTFMAGPRVLRGYATPLSSSSRCTRPRARRPRGAAAGGAAARHAGARGSPRGHVGHGSDPARPRRRRRRQHRHHAVEPARATRRQDAGGHAGPDRQRGASRVRPSRR